MDVTEAIRLTALCVATAMICAILRAHRPELAMAVSLAAGAAIVAALAIDLKGTLPRLEGMWTAISPGEDPLRESVSGMACVAVLAELGAQICSDAGESAMAGRIALIARVAAIALCLPLVMDIADAVSRLLA